jgi:putative SOS response-associated peptidase YedK
MCGRYVTPEEAAIERFWQLPRGQVRDPLGARFNVAPTTPVPIVFIENGAPVIARARWGLVPIWWKEPKPPGFTFNARIEEAAAKPMWKNPLKNFRCLVPALGWYEWKEVETVDPTTGEVKKAKQPYFLHPANSGIAHFAGLMARRRAEGEGYELSCSILTRAAAGPATEVHDRMPVVLTPDAYSAWMDPAQTDSEKALELAVDKTDTDLRHYRVSSRVNQAKNEGEELLAPLES